MQVDVDGEQLEKADPCEACHDGGEEGVEGSCSGRHGTSRGIICSPSRDFKGVKRHRLFSNKTRDCPYSQIRGLVSPAESEQRASAVLEVDWRRGQSLTIAPVSRGDHVDDKGVGEDDGDGEEKFTTCNVFLS